MPKKTRRRRRKVEHRELLLDRSDYYEMRMTAIYLQRHLKTYRTLGLDEAFFDLLASGLNEDLGEILDRALKRFDGPRREEYGDLVDRCMDAQSRFTDIFPCILERAPKALERGLMKTFLEVLEERIQALSYRGQSQLEKSLQGIKKMFNLKDQEVGFCFFLYLNYLNPWLKTFFVDELHCQRLNRRKVMANALGLTNLEMDQVLQGTLRKIDFFSMDSDCLDINLDFLFLFEDSGRANPMEKFFGKVLMNSIPLEFHTTVQDQLAHVLDLLKAKPQTSTHVLIYGPPGTGKTSFAQGVVKALGIPGYQVALDQENRSINRRTGIMTCLNMTNAGDGALILVDEADNILNTEFSWLFRGETQDKGWLNQLLEYPGARMIWITNEIEMIEPSVLRRFAFSLKFKAFTRNQRVQVWNNVLKQKKAKGLLTPAEIQEMATKYKVSPGVIALAVTKARETQGTRKGFQKALRQGMEAYQTLANYGDRPRNRDQVEDCYSLEGLNLQGDIPKVLDQLERFGKFLEKDQNTIANLNLLFYGPPGTGKSQLARYLGKHLDREILTKRGSDLLSPFVGVTEKMIREAFEEAEREQAILVIDEVDSFLSSRDQAYRSWEITQTNEFLATMENYRGILICTTNRLKALDQASIRRFQYKLGFNYLNPEGVLVFYRKLLAPLVKRPLTQIFRDRLIQLQNLTPGDFKTVRDSYGFEEERLGHKDLVQALAEEARVKRLQRGESQIGF
jgi:transitional endoplasmic reticulum ATPase